MQVIAALFGALLGALWEDSMGVPAGALLGWLILRSLRQARLIDELRQRLDAPKAAARRVAEDPSSDAALARAPAATSASVEPFKPEAAPVSPPPQPPHAPPIEPEPQRRSRPAAAPGPLAPIWRWMTGGNTIVKLGVGILFIGLAFLAKYASEHVSLPIEFRLAGIAGVAIVLLVLGWRLRLKRPGYAHALQGGAVAVLYLTLFVAFRFYGVLAVGPVFALMVAVAALAAALAVLQDARALAVIGALGGFATPLLVSTGSGDQVALFSYYLVLNGGIAAVAWFKTWRALNLVGFLFTFVVGAAWGVMRYSSADYASSQAFLIAFFVLFNAILLLPARRADAPGLPHRVDGWVNGSLLFGLPTITFVLQHGLVRHIEFGSALSALALAAFYVAMALAMRRRASLAVTFEASLAIAVVFLTLVIPFALDAHSTAGAWALEGAGLVWLGLRQARRAPRWFGYALLVLAGTTMTVAGLFSYHRPDSPLNATFFNALLVLGASLAAAYFVQRACRAQGAGTNTLAGTGVGRVEALAEPLLIAWATLWGLAAMAWQIDAFVPGRTAPAAWLAGLSALAALYALLAARLDWRRLALPVLAHAPLMAWFVLDGAGRSAGPLAHGGIWAWPLALAVHALALWRSAARWPTTAATAIHALGALVLAALGALQGRAAMVGWGDFNSAWAWLGWLAVPAVLLLALPRDGFARLWPVRMAQAAYQGGAGAVLTLGLLLWTLLANWFSNGSALPLPYLPLLNPLDLGVATALLAAALWLRSPAATALPNMRTWFAPAAVGSAGFVWLNAILIRTFHHYDGVPFRVDAWMRSLPVHTGLTLLWAATALALMWHATRRALRAPWIVGAALLAAVVLKLVLVDLSGSGTVTRIVSFIGVGVLMLVIGYVAPLPSHRSRDAQA
jgi:uncharacterized membrane protein